MYTCTCVYSYMLLCLELLNFSYFNYAHFTTCKYSYNCSFGIGNNALHQDPLSQPQESASTGNIPEELLKATTYAGLVYYEEKGVEDLVTFTAAKKLDALVQVRMFVT